VQRYLGEHGVSTALHYPIPLHLQAAFAERGEGPGSYPVTERAAQELLSLPMYPHLRREQVAEVGRCLKNALA
jgi:dTDP-4-amino-4,6-dideoxygalactose transaminase